MTPRRSPRDRRRLKWRMARQFAAVAVRSPHGLEIDWTGALTTTPDLAMTLASMLLDGMRARSPRDRYTKGKR